MIKFWIVTIIVQSQKFDLLLLVLALRIIDWNSLSSSQQIITCILIDCMCWQFPFADIITTAKLSFHTDTIEYLIMDTSILVRH
jgi:hypothetical protein